MTPKRAILSVYNKRAIDILAQFLIEQNYEIISSGGTFKLLSEKNIPVKKVSETHANSHTLFPFFCECTFAERSIVDCTRRSHQDVMVVSVLPESILNFNDLVFQTCTNEHGQEAL